MLYKEIQTGEIFNLGNTPSYPKLKTQTGYVDMRDKIVNNKPNEAVLSAEITIIDEDDLVVQFKETKESILDWVKEVKNKYL